ncbi:MAG: hypothetical protein KGL39_27175 [Patescibacteria group bacterium]|nr:hypothetical protein [Patescibacteria group bacterium]
MKEVKHFGVLIVSWGGLFGAITLERLNQYAALACATLGCIASIFTIYHRIKQWKKGKP